MGIVTAMRPTDDSRQHALARKGEALERRLTFVI